MSKEDISKLITELKELKIRELQVLNALESAIQNQTEPTPNAPTAAAPGTTARLPIFQIGDQVVITNKISSPNNRFANKGDRTAVVLKVALSRVDIKTSNGTKTWRAPHNLRLRRQDE
jgi:hypothetical protein